MLTNTTPSSRRSAAMAGGRLRGGRARGGRAPALVSIGLLALILLLAGPTPAPDADAAPSTSTPTPSQGIGAPAEPVAPTIQVADSSREQVAVSGTATPEADLRVLDPAHPASSLCTPTAGSDGRWSCTVVLASGADQTLTVRDLTDTALDDVQSAPFSVLAAPVVTTRSGIDIGARVDGTGYPGARVAVTADGRAVATATVADSGRWSTVLSSTTVPSGRYSVQTTQSSSRIPAVPVSTASPAVVLTIDREAPAAPRVLHPAAGSTITQQPLVFDGTGETGATVTTYIDSNPVCTAVVQGGLWRCSSEGLLLPARERRLQAAQRDAAGNYGAPSAAVIVTFAAPSPSATPSGPAQSPTSDTAPTPSDSSDPSTTPSTSAPSAPGAAGGGSTGSDGTTGGGGSGSSGGSGSGSLGSGSGQNPGVADSSSWSGPTGFGGTLPTLSQGLGGWSWMWALALGLVFLLLIVVPLRLAASALGGRLAVRAHRFAGRNRSLADRDAKSILSPAAGAVLALTVGAVLIALAAGVDDQVRYVRLVVAIAIGIAAINGLGVVLPSWLVGRRLGLGLRLAVSPRLLAGAVAACIATRVFGIDPPLALGVLLAAGLADTGGRVVREQVDVRARGILATCQLGALAALSFVAWIAHGLMPATSTAFAVEITREALATTCLAGLGSLIVLLVPLGGLPGRALYSWSRPTLIGFAVIGVAMAAVVYLGGPDETFPVVALLVASAAFATLALGAWAWVRFVEPSRDDS